MTDDEVRIGRVYRYGPGCDGGHQSGVVHFHVLVVHRRKIPGQNAYLYRYIGAQPLPVRGWFYDAMNFGQVTAATLQLPDCLER